MTRLYTVLLLCIVPLAAQQPEVIAVSTLSASQQEPLTLAVSDLLAQGVKESLLL